MARKSFWEMMEREIDFQEEYEKIEDVIIQQEHAESLDDLIETVFGKWEQRKNYMSFWELRLHMNFTYSQTQRYPTEYVPDRNDIKMEDFLLYSEMILNMLELLNRETRTIYLSKIQLIQKTIVYDLEKINYKAVKQKNGEIIIIQKDAAVSVVVDFVESDVAQILIKYKLYISF